MFNSYLVVLPQRLSVGHCEQRDAHLWTKKETKLTKSENNVVNYQYGQDMYHHHANFNQLLLHGVHQNINTLKYRNTTFYNIWTILKNTF